MIRGLSAVEYPILVVGCVLMLACSACKRVVDCHATPLNVSVSGFDSMDIINVRVERLTIEGKPDSILAISPLNLRRLKSNNPAAGYEAYLFDAWREASFRIHIGNYTANLTDIYFDGYEEKQPFGWSEVEPCTMTSHYTLNGKTFSSKPSVGYSTAVVIYR